MAKKNSDAILNDLARMVQKGFSHVDTQFDHVDSRFDKIENGLDRIERILLENHEQRIKRLEEALNL